MKTLAQEFDRCFNSNDKKCLKELFLSIEKGPTGNLDARVKDENYDGDTALHLAVKHKQYGAVEALLKAGADPNIKTRLHETALTMAVTEFKDTRMLELLLKDKRVKIDLFTNGKFVGDIDDMGQMPALYIACSDDKLDHLRLLLKHGANPYVKFNSLDYDTKMNAIEACVADKALKALKVLADHGLDLSKKGFSGMTPYDFSVKLHGSGARNKVAEFIKETLGKKASPPKPVAKAASPKPVAKAASPKPVAKAASPKATHVYKGKEYVLEKGPRGGNFITVDGKKKYVS